MFIGNRTTNTDNFKLKYKKVVFIVLKKNLFDFLVLFIINRSTELSSSGSGTS